MVVRFSTMPPRVGSATTTRNYGASASSSFRAIRSCAATSDANDNGGKRSRSHASPVTPGPRSNTGRMGGKAEGEGRSTSTCVGWIDHRMRDVVLADGSTARLSGRHRNRSNSQTACGVDGQRSGYPWPVERPRRERRAVAGIPGTLRKYRAEALVAQNRATCAFATPSFLGIPCRARRA